MGKFEHKPSGLRDNYQKTSKYSDRTIWVYQDNSLNSDNVIISISGNGDEDSAIGIRFTQEDVDTLIMILIWYRMRMKDD